MPLKRHLFLYMRNKMDELPQEEQDDMVLSTLKTLNSTCQNALGNISEIKIVYDELGKGKIETVWF